MAIVGPRPESLSFADCYAGDYSRVLEHKPGIFGPSQVVFRNENRLYEEGCDAELFYRSVLFPLKASIDLAYYPRRNIFSDAGWAIRGVLAVLGWSFLPAEKKRCVAGVDAWVQEFSERSQRLGWKAVFRRRQPPAWTPRSGVMIEYCATSTPRAPD